jgi:hypothetical protein
MGRQQKGVPRSLNVLQGAMHPHALISCVGSVSEISSKWAEEGRDDKEGKRSARSHTLRGHDMFNMLPYGLLFRKNSGREALRVTT